MRTDADFGGSSLFTDLPGQLIGDPLFLSDDRQFQADSRKDQDHPAVPGGPRVPFESNSMSLIASLVNRSGLAFAAFSRNRMNSPTSSFCNGRRLKRAAMRVRMAEWMSSARVFSSTGWPQSTSEADAVLCAASWVRLKSSSNASPGMACASSRTMTV